VNVAGESNFEEIKSLRDGIFYVGEVYEPNCQANILLNLWEFISIK